MAMVAVYFASKVSMGIGRDIRGAVFKAVQRFSAQEINHFGTPSLITRNTNDVQQIQLFLQMALTMMVLAPIMCVGGVIMALKEDVKLSALLVVAVPVMLVIISLLFWKAVPLVPVDPVPYRPGQPRAKRADHRRAGDPRFRAHRAGTRSASQRQTRP